MIPVLPVWRVIALSWRLPFLHRLTLLRILWLPLLLLIALDFAIAQVNRIEPILGSVLFSSDEEWILIDPSAETPDGYTRLTDEDDDVFIVRPGERPPPDSPTVTDGSMGGSMQLNFLLELLRLAILAPIMVAWHRTVQPSSGAGRPAGAMPLRLGRAEFRYLGFGALLAMATAVLGSFFSFPIGMLGSGLLQAGLSGFWFILILSTLSLAPASYPAMRMSPILPLRAAGDPRAPDEVWRMTRGNGWRLVLAMGLTGLPLGYLALISRFNAAFSTTGQGLYFEIAAVILLPAFAILAASCLSVATRLLDAGAEDEVARDDASGRLPVWPTITDAFGFLFANWRTALRLGWIAVLVSFVIDLLFDQLLGLLSDYGLIAVALIDFVATAAYVPAIAIAVVPWHRMILLRQQPGGVRLGARERRYILWAVLLSAIYLGVIWAAYLPTGLFGTVPFPFNLIYIAGSFVAVAGFLLLSPILPAVAVDGRADLKRAFALSEGNRLRFVIVSIAVWVPSILFVGVLPETVFDGYRAYLLDLIYNAVYVFDAMITATALSLCYHRLGGMDGGGMETIKGDTE